MYRRLIAVVAIMVMAVVGPFVATASAAIPSAGSQSSSSGSGTAGSFVCANAAAATAYNQTYASAKEYLPITRWSSVAGGDLHSRLSGGLLGFGSITGTVQRTLVESGALTLGNALWRAGTGITDVSSRFCFSDQVGYQADKMSASLGDAILSSGIVVVLVVLALVSMIWKAAKGAANPFRKVMSIALTVGILGTMIQGARNTTYSGGSVHFGTLSPGWLVSHSYQLIDNFAALPAAAIASQSDGLTGLAGSNQGALSCAQYEQNMLTAYKESFGPGNATEASLPLALDAMWEQTGLRTYIDTQFGANNPYGGYVFCRLLDSQAGISTERQIANTKPAAPSLVGTTNPTAPAWTSTGSTNVNVDTSLVGWAACRPNGTGWTVDPAWASLSQTPNGNPSQITPSTCASWWTNSNPDWATGTALDWGSNASNISQYAATQPAVADYLYSLHGNFQGPAIASAVTYALASVVVFLVFVVLGLAVIIAKVALLFLMMLLGLVAAISIIPSKSGGNRLAGVGKHVLGMMIFSAGAQILLSLVALMTGELVLMSGALAGTGSLMAILLTSFAPIASVVILHHFFKKILKAPSPFQASGALQYGKMASSGAIGGAMGAALEQRFSRRLKHSASDAMAKRIVTGRSRSLPGNRRGGMAASIPAAEVGGAGGRRRSHSAAGWAPGAATANAGPRVTGSTGPTTPRATTTTGAWTTGAMDEAWRDGLTPEEVRQRHAETLKAAGYTDQRLANAQTRSDKAYAKQQRQDHKDAASSGRAELRTARRRTGNTWLGTAFDNASTHPATTARKVGGALKTTAKYGALGAGLVTVSAFGGIPVAAAAAAYGLHRRRSIKAAAEREMTNYRSRQDQRAAAWHHTHPPATANN